MDEREWLAERFEEHRTHLRAVLKEPRLRKPTPTLTSVTESGVFRRSSLARSMRRRWR